MRKAQCLYQSVRLLLTYHCPTLALHIEHKASLSPELYLTSYVLTLFARSLDLDTTTKARASTTDTCNHPDEAAPSDP